MKNLLILALTGIALIGSDQSIYAKEKERGGGKGRKAEAPGQIKKVTAQKPARVVTQSPARASVAPVGEFRPSGRNVGRGAVRDERTSFRARSSPDVSFGTQTRRHSRFEADSRRDYGYYRPPVTVYRDWDHDRVYDWDNHRWHWYDGAWVIFNANIGYDAPVRTYSYAESGSLTASVQRELARQGYDPGPIDGVMGAQTQSAILAFQRDHNLAVTGRIDTPLLQELNL